MLKVNFILFSTRCATDRKLLMKSENWILPEKFRQLGDPVCSRAKELLFQMPFNFLQVTEVQWSIAKKKLITEEY